MRQQWAADGADEVELSMHERAHAELARLREAYPHRFGWAVYQHLFEVARQTRRAADAISMHGMSETERHYANVDFARQERGFVWPEHRRR